MDHEAKIASVKKVLEETRETLALHVQGASNTLRSGEYKRGHKRLDLGHLSQIVELDPSAGHVVAEPRVTMRKLCAATLAHGLLPPVVPEFPSITVGGAIMGAALESSSHKFGQFNDTALSYELLLGNGEQLTASPKAHPDLFYGISGSYGTLALLTAAKLPLIPAPTHVTLHHVRFSSVEELVCCLTESKADYVEGIVIAKDWAVACLGTLEGRRPDLPLFRQRAVWDPWYYQHVCNITEKKSTYTEQMPLKDYLFRFDRSAFWMGRLLLSIPLIIKTLRKDKQIASSLKAHARSLAPTTNPSLLFRLLFGWTLSSEKLYRLWHAVPKALSETLFFVQDFYAPKPRAASLAQEFQEETGIYPLWLCPLRGTCTPQFLSPHFGADSFVNIGVYGVPKSEVPIPRLTERLERRIVEEGGRKMLYAYTYYSQEEFSKIYDMQHYRALRERYHAEKVFLPLYNKVASML